MRLLVVASLLLAGCGQPGKQFVRLVTLQGPPSCNRTSEVTSSSCSTGYLPPGYARCYSQLQDGTTIGTENELQVGSDKCYYVEE